MTADSGLKENLAMLDYVVSPADLQAGRRLQKPVGKRSGL